MSRCGSSPYLVEDSLILWEQPAFGDLAVLEPIQAVSTPPDSLTASLGSPRSDHESVLIVCQNVVHRDFKGVGSKLSAASHVLHHFGLAPILSRDRAATRNMPHDVVGEDGGKGCVVPLGPRIVLTSQQSLVGMHQPWLPALLTSPFRVARPCRSLSSIRLDHMKGSRQARHEWAPGMLAMPQRGHRKRPGTRDRMRSVRNHAPRIPPAMIPASRNATMGFMLAFLAGLYPMPHHPSSEAVARAGER